MLKKLTIERFKSIHSTTLELGRVNMFIGGNGAGKSNILEAIGVLSAALERGLGESDLGRKGVRITPPELMKSAFKNHVLPKTLQLTAIMDDEIMYRLNLTGSEDDPLLAFFSERCTYHAANMFGRSPHGATLFDDSIHGRLTRYRSMWDQVRIAFEFPTSVAQALDGLSEYAIYAPQTSFLRGIQPGRVDTPPVGLHGEGLPEAVHGMLAQWHEIEQLKATSTGADKLIDVKRRALDLIFLPQWASSVETGVLDRHLTSRELPNRDSVMVYFNDKFMHSRRKKLSVYDSSEGTLFLLFVAILISHNDSPRTFALDNIDSALNPKMTRSLLETVIETTTLACENDLSCGPRQAFLTSHNPTSLDAFDLFDEEQRVFVVERNKEGHTDVTRLRPRDGMSKHDWYEAKSGRSLSQLWLDGEIRGALGPTL